MSFSSLPEELLDQICSYLTKNVASYYEDFIDRASLSTLCLVSRQTLPPARRALYYKPFDETLNSASISQQQAFGFLVTLQKNAGALGQLVRNLLNINPWLSSIRYTALTSQQDAMDLNTYYCDILKACPALQQVSLSFSTINNGLALLRALGLHSLASPTVMHPLQATVRTSSIRYISFSSIYRPSTAGVTGLDLSAIFERLHPSLLPSLRTVEFVVVEWELFGDSSSTIPCFPIPVTSLNLYEATTSSGSIFPFFPRQSSTLQALRIEGCDGVINLDFKALSRMASTDLRKLEINVWAHRDGNQGMLLTSYATQHEPPRLPPDGFQSYPLLTFLDLTNTHGPSLALLQTLVKSSPSLTHVSFSSSRWICSYNPSSRSHDEIFPESEIIPELKKFLHLKDIHFGYLPTVDPLRYEGMKKELETSGIKAECQICT